MNFFKILKAKKITNSNGSITILEKSKKIEFDFLRLFVVSANRGSLRGKHAHKKCIQLFMCLNGSVEIESEDINGIKKKFILNDKKKYLIIPTMTWCTQKYLRNNTVLAVLCSEKYSERDYIRNYKNFKQFQKDNKWKK